MPVSARPAHVGTNDMQFQLKMPDLTTNDSSVRITRWIFQPGDSVMRGQPLLEVETDKATMEVESAVTGRLQEVICQADEEVSVGQVIAIFEVAESGTMRRKDKA